jgi:hypothetical protein
VSDAARERSGFNPAYLVGVAFVAIGLLMVYMFSDQFSDVASVKTPDGPAGKSAQANPPRPPAPVAPPPTGKDTGETPSTGDAEPSEQTSVPDEKPEEKSEEKVDKPKTPTPEPKDPDGKMPADAGSDKPKPPDGAPSPLKPLPMPEPMPEPPSADARAKVVDGLLAARKAMEENKLDDARKILGEARTWASAEPLREWVEEESLLLHYVEEFWQSVRESLKKLEGPLEVGEVVVNVVEASPDGAVIRVAGENRRYETMELPPGLAAAIAGRWLDPAAASTKVIRGAYFAVVPSVDRGEVRQIWKEAELMGADVAPLMNLLDRDYASGDVPAPKIKPKRGPVPPKDLVAEAALAVRKKYGKATSRQERYDLAKKLMADASTPLPSEAMRFALYDAALEMARLGGLSQLLVQGVDEMAAWFEIDALAVKTDGLVVSAKKGPADFYRASALEALYLVDEAVKVERFDVAVRLATIAYSAAGKSRDLDLSRKAGPRKREVEKLAKEHKEAEKKKAREEKTKGKEKNDKASAKEKKSAA